ncbi:MAG: TerB N-terminal domain-containing protein [Clostridia bacterium]|nr:TerB N-terminal domain-containing protein [Clostridia bacterium]
MAFDADGVWDVDDLVPKRKKPSKSRYSFDTDTVELTFGQDGENKSEKIPDSPPERTDDRLAAARAAMRSAELKYAEKDADRRIRRELSDDGGERFPRHEDGITEGAAASSPSEPPVISYSPDNPFIKRVEILPWPTKFAFRERFCDDARRLFEKNVSDAPFADFFSYSPGYSQLTAAQSDYYLFWRGAVRRGEYLRTTASYITLFVAETVNLPELVPPETGIKYLCGIYGNYAARFETVRKELPRWILDYCLINRVRPVDGFTLYDSARSDGELATLLGGFDAASDPIVRAVASASSHSYTESRVLTDENREIFGKYVPTAVAYTIKRAIESGTRPFSASDRAWKSVRTGERPSYSGLVCAYGSKRVIKTETVSVIRSPELCHAVGDITKYAENRVRAMLAIKNRYHISQITPELKKFTDDYFAANSAGIESAAPVPEYEKYYDAVESELSAERAAEIESAAWQTTDILTADDEPEVQPEPEPVRREIPAEGPGKDDISALRAALEGPSEFSAEARRLGTFPEALADRVNGVFFDEFGDNVVDAVEEGFAVTFYSDEVRALLERSETDKG